MLWISKSGRLPVAGASERERERESERASERKRERESESERASERKRERERVSERGRERERGREGEREEATNQCPSSWPWPCLRSLRPSRIRSALNEVTTVGI